MWVRGSLQEQKWLQDRCFTNSTPAWVTAHEIWNSGAYCSQVRECLSGSSGGLLSAKLVCNSFRQLGLSKSVTRLPLLLIQVWGGMELVYLVSFRNFLTLLSCLCPELKELPYMMKCFTSFRTSCVLKQLSSEVDYKTEEIVKQPPSPSYPFLYVSHFPSCWKLLVVHTGVEGQWPKPYSSYVNDRKALISLLTQEPDPELLTQLEWEAGGR